MTSADTAADPATDSPAPSRALPRATLLIATILLAAGSLVYLAATVSVVWPGPFDGAAFLSYGRLLPAGAGLLVAWLLVAAVGAAWYVIPRVGGGRVDIRLMAPAALLTAAAAGAGALASAVGLGEGGRYVEAPWLAEAVLALGLLLAAAAVTRSAWSRGGDLPMAAWYLLGSLWWGFAAAAVAALPGLEGIPAALQARFAATVLTGLAPAAAGLGAVYYLVGRVEGSVFHPRLGPIGFWSLGFSWLWLAPASLQYGPTSDWLETIPVLFAFGLVVALLAILADLTHAMRGRWSALSDDRPLRLALLGVVPFGLLVGQILVQTLRGPSTVVRFTDWEAALEVLTLLGGATLWLAALIAAVFPAGSRQSRALGTVHRYSGSAGLIAALIGLWVAGLQQGFTWVGSVEPGEMANAGDAFRNSVVPLQAMRITAIVGLSLIVVGVLAHLAAVLQAAVARTASSRRPVEVAGAGQGAPVVLRGSLALFVLAGLAVFVLPALEMGGGSQPEQSSMLAAPAAGREVYVAEGCWQCHTQQVRPIVTDVGLGPVSEAADYAGDPAGILGHRRIGPDLTHVAARGWDAGTLTDHLTDPRRARPWSVMPSYAYLDEGDLEDLAAYLMSLE